MTKKKTQKRVADMNAAEKVHRLWLNEVLRKLSEWSADELQKLHDNLNKIKGQL